MKVTGNARRTFWIALFLLAYSVFGAIELARAIYLSEPDGVFTILNVLAMCWTVPLTIGLFHLSLKQAHRTTSTGRSGS